ncbi:hypothetical protein X975_26800, partial [Stegodyphus mimosarum]
MTRLEKTENRTDAGPPMALVSSSGPQSQAAPPPPFPYGPMIQGPIPQPGSMPQQALRRSQSRSTSSLPPEPFTIMKSRA